MKQKRTKRLTRIHESQPLTMWHDDLASLVFIFSEEFIGSAIVFHDKYGMTFCVANNWEPI